MPSKIDDATYKQTYYFTDDFRDTAKENPSIKGQPDINTTIKENPYRSNVEIEGGELVLQPDLSALFKANGNKHSKGGMDVLLRPEAFIFSDFKDLAITEDEKEQFELKEGGSKSPTKNTPAEVVKKNIDVKHYNTLINNISDPYKDELARKSSAMMLEKYIGTLGNIAFLQENKKDFPDGLPSFSLGSAPVFDVDVKGQVDESKQYAKYGGAVDNPSFQRGSYVPKSGFVYRTARDAKGNIDQQGYMYDPNTGTWVRPPAASTTAAKKLPVPQNPYPEWGLWQGDKLPIFQNRFGVTNAADKIKDLDAIAQQLGYNGPKNNKAFQEWLYKSSPENKAVIDKWHNTYEDPSIAVDPSKRNRFDSKIGIRWTNAMNEIINRPQPPAPATPAAPPAVNAPSPIPGQVPGDPTGGRKRADWEFTPWQKISQLYSWGQYANVQKYMPYRSRYNATYADPSLLNPEQTIGDVKGQVTQQLNALGTLNPIMRNAQAAASYGAALNQIPAIRTSYDNQNAQIKNQFSQYNNQVRNNESLVNMQNDQQYYQQAVEGRKNFSNLRSFAANNAMNNTLRDVEDNQTLAYKLLSQNNPAYGFDWDNGDFYRNPMDIRDVQSDNSADAYKDLFEAIEQVTDPYQKAQLLEKAYRQKNILPYLKNQQSAFTGKKGGKVKNPYRY
jgi:hypothetical protein